VVLYCGIGMSCALLIALRWRDQLWEEEQSNAR
jgi:hypothetical protein